MRHIAFGVDDVVVTRTFLEAQQVEPATEILQVPDESGRRYFFVNDPDGVLIEFIEVGS